MSGQDGTGMVEVDAPRRLKRWVDKFSAEQLEAIVTQLHNGNWLSNSEEVCESRSQAYYRAEALIEKIVSASDLERYMLERRTWPEKDGQRWAIRLRKE
jgi:hypothetical protein